MKRKFLSAILFGAVLVASTSTFVSCKDYDDDIENLQNQINGKATLADIQSATGSLAYVKSVSYANGVLTVDGKTYSIATSSDTNTTYTLDVTNEGNDATITLTGSDGTSFSKTISFTDTDTLFDPTALTVNEDNEVVYNGVKTGVVIPTAPEVDPTPTPVDPSPSPIEGMTVTELRVGGITIGYILSDDGTESVELLISDALPIAGFEYIPEKVLAGFGERVIVFAPEQYTSKKIVKNEVVDDKVISRPSVAHPQYRVNPSTATAEQITAYDVDDTKIVELITRGDGKKIDFIDFTIEDGILTANLEAHAENFTTDENKLDELALIFDTSAGHQISTEYVGIISKPADPYNVVLADMDTKNKGGEEHHFVLSLKEAKDQVAKIDANNFPTDETDHLVQNIGYTNAIAGVNLADYIFACDDNNEHAVFDYAAHNMKLVTSLVKGYVVNGTDQAKYVKDEKISKNILTAVNFDQVDKACIGKTPIVLAKLVDKSNDAIVAAAYVKFMYVDDEAEDVPQENDVTIKWDNDPGQLYLGCYPLEARSWKTTVKFQSTQVHTIGNSETLTALSKEQFVDIYKFDGADEASTEAGWTVTEELVDANNETNRILSFVYNADSELYTWEPGTYKVTAVYTKKDKAEITTTTINTNPYPEHIYVTYEVTIKDFDEGDTVAFKNKKIDEYWNDDYTDVEINVVVPGTMTNDCAFKVDMTGFYEGNTKNIELVGLDAEKYKYLGEYTYAFEFSTKNDGRKVKDYDGNIYTLSTTPTELKATNKDKEEVIAKLSGENNATIEYMEDSDFGKALLNRAPRNTNPNGPGVMAEDDKDVSFDAYIDVRISNECEIELPIKEGDGSFVVNFVRPVNIEKNPAKDFVDGQNDGSELKITDLFNLFDWRFRADQNKFSEHLNYYNYYGVESVEVDAENIITNMNGHEWKEKAKVSDVNKNIVFEYKPGTSTGIPAADITEAPDYGTLIYTNNGQVLNDPFDVRIPVIVTYKWGKIKAMVQAKVKTTI